MAAKLKVYATQIGFHDAVVAAPSQSAALAAWDVRENLFARGLAALTDEPQAVEAATAHPGVVLRRAAGSGRPFTRSPAAPAAPAPRPRGKAKAAPAKPRRDRRALDAAERELAELTQAQDRWRDDLARRRSELDAEARRQDQAFAARRTALQGRLDRARRAFEQGG